MIEVDAVTKRFGPTMALGGVSLSVHEGEVVGLVGPNGAGKTTLVRILSTLLVPDGGEVRVAGHDVVRESQRVRRLIGLAGQSAALDDWMTGRENLELVGRLYGLSRDERRHRAQAVLDRFGLVDAADRAVKTYSGGMRRRLDLGATFVGRPAVVLLDEPTAGLDPRSRQDVWQLVEQLAAEGTTVLLTTQYLEEVERLADRIVVIDRGSVIASGSADELKDTIGRDVLEARVIDVTDLDAACSVVAGLGDGSVKVDADEQRLSVPTTGGAAALVGAARRLDDAGIALADLRLHRPSLDDVFFALTGQTTNDRPDATENPSPSNAWASHRREGDETPKRSLPRADSSAARHAWSDMIAVTRRYLTFLRRTPQALFFATVQPVLMLLTLNAVFGGLVSQVGGGPYVQYLLPGMVVMNVMLNAGMTAFGIAFDLQTGIMDRFRSLPMSRSAVLLGRTVADLVRNALTIGLLILVGFGMGFRLHGGYAAGITAVAVVLLFAYSTSWLFACVGLTVKDPQAAQFASFAPVLPLVFLSGAWIPVETMAGGLQAFARNQPVNVAVEAVRALANGAPAFHWVWLSAAWSTGILVVFSTIAVRQYRTAAS